MVDGPLELSEKLISGTLSIAEHPPLSIRGGTTLTELDDGVGFVESFGNVAALKIDDSLVLVDVGGPLHSQQVYDAVRAWSRAPVRSVIYTHGHVDHVSGIGHFDDERCSPPATVFAHENVARRFDRYKLTHGYNGTINQRQFQLAAPIFPNEFRYPDQTYVDELVIDMGGESIELHHNKGETDDGTWVWLPQRRVLCTGDLFIWAAPNCGNPQKVQRYPWEWASALRTMSELGAELMLPGHGLPINGVGRIRGVLGDTAEWLESIHSQALRMMNDGARLDDLIHSVVVPEHLRERPWLQPIYDDPEFVVRNIWRLYGGWYDGNPATLRPASELHLAEEVSGLAGGAKVLARRAQELSDQGNHRLAGHLIEFAAASAGDDSAIHEIRAEIYRRRVRHEASVMAKGVFRWAQSESQSIVESHATD